MAYIFKHQYYVPWTIGYDVEAIKAALQKLAPNKGTGLKDLVRIRTARQFGWFNQPDVVCFSTFFCPENVMAYILPELRSMGLNIMQKDW